VSPSSLVTSLMSKLSAFERVRFHIEAESALLLRRAMAFVAAFLEDGPHIAVEVHGRVTVRHGNREEGENTE
jgi:hypothetical protein